MTYRVYDYGRTDKNGNPRELHIEKALQVTDLKKFEPVPLETGCVGACEYFTARKYVIHGEKNFVADNKSFHCVTCLKGTGEIDGQKIEKGESFFIPAAYGEYRLNGEMEIILTCV